MSIRPSPLLGYNNNVRHKGKVFHIQTEDSGAKYGHIMTHLFADGGRILKSVKTSYAEYIGTARMTEIVREMMKQQHKAMFIALRDGKFDAVADLASASEAPAPPSAPRSVGRASDRRSSVPPPPPSANPRTATPPPPLSGAARADAAAPMAELLASAARARAQPEELPIDIDALERAAAVDGALPSQRRSSELPPPPSELLREKAGSSRPPPSTPPRGEATSAGGTERRYAPTRPASIFGQARPQHGKSIFGEDLLGDKSLDEAILSYLSDDLDDGE